MRTSLFPVWLLLLFTLMLSPVSSRATSPGEDKDWQDWAERIRWTFESEQASPLWCALYRNGSHILHDVRLKVNKGGKGIDIEIVVDGEVRARWHGHRNSVFQIRDGRLYYADFSRSMTGGTIKAVDLDDGKVIWSSRLRALGAICHSAYRNQLNLSASDDVVVVFGKESRGRYVEYKRTSDGKTVGHRTFD